MRLSPIDPATRQGLSRAALVLLAYLGTFALLSRLVGPSAYALSTAPVLACAWLLGARGALLSWPFVTGVHLYAGSSNVSFGTSPTLAFTLGSLALLALGLSIGLLRDRTEKQLSRQRRVEARYERAACGAHDVLWEWKADSEEVYFSAQWPALLGCEASELSPTIGEWLRRVHRDDREKLERDLAFVREGKASSFENEHRLRRKDGMPLWVLCRGVASVAHADEPLRITGWLTDITEHKRSEEQLRRLAFNDALTGLPNRSLFVDRLRKAHERAQQAQRCLAVLVIDLDRFKVVNDSLGHSAGDRLLMKAARVLRRSTRPSDTVARLGGDEFAVLLEDIERLEQADDLAADLLGVLERPLEIAGHRMVMSASIGVSRATPGRMRDPDDMLREADMAMYRAKHVGGSRVELFDPTQHSDVGERLDLEAELRKALEGETLHVHYQPIVDVESATVVGFEALARWHHPVYGPVSPGKFIPVAEEAGLIEQLGESILRLACRQSARLCDLFPDAPAWRMGVNLSVAQIARSDLLDRIEEALELSGLPASYLSLEITESGLLEDTETASRTFAALRARGVRIAMDDFGTGYSSLQYLRRFRVDTIKIDGSFVRDLDHSGGEEICAAIITLGRDLGLSVIAEGVERADELERLRGLGGRYAQGFLLSRPLSAEDLERWLASMPGWHLKLAS